MTLPNLVVTFTVAGDSRVHVRGAARIKVDGRGGLTLFDSEKGSQELVSLGSIQSFTICSLTSLAIPTGSVQ